MDRTILRIITALKDEQQKLLESLGDFPKKDPYEHGVQVGVYQGLKKFSEIIESVLNDDEVRDDQL